MQHVHISNNFLSSNIIRPAQNLYFGIIDIGILIFNPKIWGCQIS